MGSPSALHGNEVVRVSWTVTTLDGVVIVGMETEIPGSPETRI